MSNTYITPNMSLIVPVTEVDPGPDWANSINGDLTILDGHNHTPGNGVLITPQAMNINSDLSFGTNNATLLRSVRFNPNGSTLSSSTDIGCLYEAGVDLYYNDGNGNTIRFTQSGTIVGAPGTITGLPSGTASASYAAGTFTFQSATLTSANIDGGSYILRNNVASSFGLTLQPPTLSSNYSLTLPALPVQVYVMTLGTSGIISTITYNNIASNMSSPNFPGTVKANGQNVLVSQENASNNIAIIRGGINASGSTNLGEGFTALRSSAGIYSVTFGSAFADSPVVVVSLNTLGSTPTLPLYIVSTYGISHVSVGITVTDLSGNPTDFPVNFIVMGIV